MHQHENRAAAAQATNGSDRPVPLLAEVDFKWLMAGQGWWIDPARFHQDPAYAGHFLKLALASPSRALRDCAASLLSLVDGRAR
ncbi:MAG: hypothetical protein JWR68_2120 [Polaromonas sp.]|nr:hypothetical protein [Polaromonas sp.]MDB5780008.1 hypothetical protein [Polaromonas sp.]